MDPLTIAALIQGIPALAQGVTGVVQGIQGRNAKDNLVNPTYAPPQSAVDALGNARNQSYSMSMAGQGNMQNELEQRNASSVSDVLAGASSGVDALAALTAINRNTLGAQNQIGFQAANDYQRRQAELRQQLNNMAGYEDKAFEINTMQPFLRDSAAASALTNAGMVNTYQGIKGLSNVGSTITANMEPKSAPQMTPDKWASIMQSVGILNPSKVDNNYQINPIVK